MRRGKKRIILHNYPFQYLLNFEVSNLIIACRTKYQVYMQKKGAQKNTQLGQNACPFHYSRYDLILVRPTTVFRYQKEGGRTCHRLHRVFVRKYVAYFCLKSSHYKKLSHSQNLAISILTGVRNGLVRLLSYLKIFGAAKQGIYSRPKQGSATRRSLFVIMYI